LAPGLLALRAPRLFDGTGAAPSGPATVLVKDGRIAEVYTGTLPNLPEQVPVREFPDGTILPGLIDAHVHVAGQLANANFTVDDPEAFTDDFMRAFARHGITSVRDTGSPDLDVTFPVFKRGRPGWPRFFGSGPDLDGSPGGPWAGLRVLDTADEAIRAVGDLAEAGVDFVKLYAWMGRDLMAAAVAEAHRRGLTVAAHVGNVMTVEEAARIGVDAFEHVRLGAELVAPERRSELAAGRSRRYDALVSFAPWRLVDVESPTTAAVIGMLVERGAYVTPTLSLSESILRPAQPGRDDSDDGWKPPGQVLDQWAASRYSDDYSDEDWRWAPIELARQMAFIGVAHRAGLRIVAGTDTPNPFIRPGSSLHREISLLHECGLSPSEAILSATRRAAGLLGRDQELGTVARGMRADLLVVQGDPTSDLAALSSVRLVLRDGEVIHEAG
jgi:imidazolonepropionase-like amidohydrolase